MNYRQTLETLYNMMPDFQHVGAGAYKPGLERVAEFVDVLGHPERAFETVHIAGTNGKGSVSHMMAAVLQAAGMRVGLYTSPHLRDFRERMRIDGEMISEQEVMDFADRHLEVMKALGLSFFEATMCMAFDWFARRGIDVAVVEAGLGGRLDSTNIITPAVSVITNIGLDHQQFLGDTLAEIAREKAGIIKRGVAAVVGERGAESDPVFESVAAEEGAPLVFAQDLYRCVEAHKEECRQTFMVERAGESFTLESDLLGDYQSRNIVTLLAAVEAWNARHSDSLTLYTVKQGLAAAALQTGLRGRWEVLGHGPLVVADTAHNAHGLQLVVQQMRDTPHDKLYIVMGVVADKDLDAILPLLPREAHYIFTEPSIARALPAEELAARAGACGLDGEVATPPRAALDKAREIASPQDMIFVGGSNFTVAEII